MSQRKPFKDLLKQRTSWVALLLAVGCFGGGYLFYKMNGNDLINGSLFGVGLLGIMMSYLRNQRQP